ncbi:hypothetical protein AAD001_05065 [Colwelliaceae bacterium 6471]
MLSEQLTRIFQDYLTAFKRYDLDAVFKCYHLPCTLQTPDKVLQINHSQEFEHAFNDIFEQLRQAKTKDVFATCASYLSLNDNIALVCIDWAFIDQKDEVFADFCAIYHVVVMDDGVKIINVVSHDLSNSIKLTHSLDITERLRVE